MTQSGPGVCQSAEGSDSSEVGLGRDTPGSLSSPGRRARARRRASFESQAPTDSESVLGSHGVRKFSQPESGQCRADSDSVAAAAFKFQVVRVMVTKT